MRYYQPGGKKPSQKAKSSKYSGRDYKNIKPSAVKNDKKPFILSGMPKLAIIALLAILITAAILIIIPATAKAQYSIGYEVYLCGKSMGIVDDPESVDAFLAEARTQLDAAYGMPTTDQLSIEYKEVAAPVDRICPAQVFTDIISHSIQVKVVANIIYVNDWPAAALSSIEDAQWVLEQSKLPYENPGDGAVFSDVTFVEEVRVEEGPADYFDLVDRETALHNLTIGPGVELKYHKVVTGESLSRIAKKEGIKVSDIRIANPAVSDTDVIHPGDNLLVVAPKNSLSIKYTEVVDRDQPEPCEIQYQDDDSKYTTQKEVIQEGSDGLSHVRAEITYINGIEVDFNILDKQVLTEPVTRIVKRGTKKVPRELTLASEGDIPLPLKSYKRISEYFGQREAPTEGASTFHKGIDLAADRGTPIYASLDGTVHYAGSGTGYGLYVRLDHDGGVETRYAHCSQLLVSKGEKVKRGQIIALVGSTGVSTGSHLHFEVRINGHAVDPLKGT